MSANREILMKFITQQNEKVKQDISMQGYKDDSPYRNNPSNTIYGTPQGTAITMQGVSTPLVGMDEFGNRQEMFPGQEYNYPGSRVVETPMAKYGGLLNKTIKCSNCGWSWKAADGGNDVSTCHKCGNENKVMQMGGKTFLQPTSDKLPEGYRIPFSDPSTERAGSIGGTNGEPAYLVPNFKYGHSIYDPIEEFKRTGEHLGGPFKTWQEADEWERTVRHPAVENRETIMFPQEKFQMGGIGGQKKRIYVESKNHPRYTAYQDSLYLYKESKNATDSSRKAHLEKQPWFYQNTNERVPDNLIKLSAEKKAYNRLTKTQIESMINSDSGEYTTSGIKMKPVSAELFNSSAPKKRISHWFEKDTYSKERNTETSVIGQYKKPQEEVIVKPTTTKQTTKPKSGYILQDDGSKFYHESIPAGKFLDYSNHTGDAAPPYKDIPEDRKPIQGIQNTLQPIGIQNDFNIEADVPQIRQQVRQPKYYDVQENINQPFGATQKNYRTSDLNNITSPDDLGPGNTRKITPRYQTGGPGGQNMYTTSGSPIVIPTQGSYPLSYRDRGDRDVDGTLFSAAKKVNRVDENGKPLTRNQIAENQIMWNAQKEAYGPGQQAFNVWKNNEENTKQGYFIPQEYHDALEKFNSQPDVDPYCGQGKRLGPDNQGCSGSVRKNEKRLKDERNRKNGGLTPYQFAGKVKPQTGALTARDSVAHQADKILQYEQLRGGPGGTPLSYYSNPKYMDMLMNNIYPQVQDIMPNANAMESSEAMDFIFNAGRDPRTYMLDQYLKSKGQTGIPNRGSFNIDMNKDPQKWAQKKPELDAIWNQYSSQINSLPANTRRQFLNKGRDWYYQNIDNPAPGVPSSNYNDTWYGRIWNTNDFTEFNPNNSKFIKKQNGGDYTGNWFKNADVMSVSNKYQKAGTVKYGTPEYAEAYNRGEVVTEDGQRSPILLDEVTIQNNYIRPRGFWEQYRDKLIEENKDAGVLGATVGAPISALFSLPQLAATKLLSGNWNNDYYKMQRPSEIIGFENTEGAFDSPVSFGKHAFNFLLDAVTDPTNLIGAGLLTKENALQGLSKLPAEFRNVVGSQIMNSQIAKGIKSAPVPRLSKIDLIDKAAINVKNDMVGKMTPEQYDALIADQYKYNSHAYDNPLVEYKGYAKPTSFFETLGSNPKQNAFQKFMGINPGNKEGLLFKEKFCLPGSECAKSANAVTNRTYTDITGMPFNAQENAHNAWHMQDQMMRHGAEDVSGLSMKVGDRVLMGNGIDQSTFAQGYTADKSVRHAGMYAGVGTTDSGQLFPLIFESGKNNAMYVNPLSHTFTGPNSAQKVIRPEQFVDDIFGKNLVEKNIRYAYRDKPSVATYSSDNKVAQQVLDEAEKHREVIKRTHDITNDEFDELRNSLVGIGAQETKLSGALPGSSLSKAKIQLQDQLTRAGLTKPIKQTLNTVKKVLNSVSNTKSDLPNFPGTSVIEMEAAKLSRTNNIPFDEALSQVRSSYQSQPKYTSSTPTPSKGMFRQKFQTELDRVSGIGTDLKNKNSVENGLGQMAENYAAVKEMYPNATARQLMDLTTLMWNSPGKVKNKSLVDFYMFGKDNPDPSKFNFDYVRKINNAKNDLINIKPQRGADEPYYNFFRNSTNYPEIQYEQGGLTKYQTKGEVTDERMMAVATKDNTPNFKPKVGVQLTPQQIEQRRVQALIDKQGTIRKHTPQSTASRIKETVLNPLTAFGYAARNESLPENFSRGERNALDMAVDIVNPAFYINQGDDALQNVGSSINNIAQGNLPAAWRDFKNAGMNTINTLPAIAEFGPAVNQFVKSQRILPFTGEYRVPSIAESIGKYRPYVAEPEKGLAPYLSQIGESGISREEEVFRNVMGHEYRNAKELENTIFLDANGNTISAPINTYAPYVEDPYITAFNAKRNMGNARTIDLNLFGFGKKAPPASTLSTPTFLQKEALLAEQELARANADAAAFSNSPFNRQKLQEFRPNQEFNVSNQQARFIDDPVLNNEYQAFRNNGNLDYPETVVEQLGNSRGNYLANNHGDMNDVVMVDKFRPNTSNVPTTSAYTDAMHEATHSRSIRLKATPQEEKIASAAWEPMIKNNDFGMPAEEAFAVQNELRASLGDIKGNRVYTEKDIPEIKNKLQSLMNTGHEYLKGTKVEDFDMTALLKSLNKIGLGAMVPAAVGAATLQQQKKGGDLSSPYNDMTGFDRMAIQELGGMLYANVDNKLPHEQSMVKYLGPGKTVIDFMKRKVVGGPVPFDEYYRENIINPRNKS